MAKETATPSLGEGGANGKEWFVLKVSSNRERTIRDSLLKRIKREGLEEFFGEIVIPTEKVKETKSGKTRVVERKLFPGYIMINMVMNDETWYLVRDTTGVGDFTGAAGKPIAMQDSEIRKMLAQGDASREEPVAVRVAFRSGDVVKIKEGSFEGFQGTVNSIDEASGKITVLVSIFGRPTPVELDHWQAEQA